LAKHEGYTSGLIYTSKSPLGAPGYGTKLKIVRGGAATQGGVHIYRLIGFRNRLAVLINWAWDYFFYDNQVRLITRE
jgi:hypothetical protein